LRFFLVLEPRLHRATARCLRRSSLAARFVQFGRFAVSALLKAIRLVSPKSIPTLIRTGALDNVNLDVKDDVPLACLPGQDRGGGLARQFPVSAIPRWAAWR